MALTWTIIATGLLVASSVATFMTMLHLRCRWDVHASSVQWLFWFFFTCVWAWCSVRSVFFVWMITRQTLTLVSDETQVDVRYTYDQLDRLDIHGILYLKDAKKAWLTAVLCLGDVALFGIAVTLFPLTYELWRLARQSMDRGAEKEQVKIRRYAFFIGSSLVVYSIAQLVLALLFGGYNIYTHRCLLGVYVLQFIALVFMASRLVMLKANGRKFESIQGTFVASPIYQRLKRIMLVYAVFAFQFQLSMLIVYAHQTAPSDDVIDFIGVSLIVYNLSGLALAITTSCSQACVFSACAPCLPEDFEAEFMHQRLAAPTDEDLEAPQVNPVFVYTDIQSSTALWNTNSEAMEAATEIHDTILRSSLLKHRGYEITTVGDAFQVAFRTIRDAVEYCMDVQLQLLVAKWPKEIRGLIPATVTQRAGRRIVFNGLRVRMGIHDACDEEGQLVKGVHAVTGKTIYTGMSELVAEFVGDLGSGGQILVTERVAAWLKHHCNELSIDVYLEHIDAYEVPQVFTHVDIYQLQPAMLAARGSFFKKPEPDATMTVSLSSEEDSSTRRQRLEAIAEDLEEGRDCRCDDTEETYKQLRTPRQAFRCPETIVMVAA